MTKVSFHDKSFSSLQKFVRYQTLGPTKNKLVICIVEWHYLCNNTKETFVIQLKIWLFSTKNLFQNKNTCFSTKIDLQYQKTVFSTNKLLQSQKQLFSTKKPIQNKLSCWITDSPVLLLFLLLDSTIILITNLFLVDPNIW